jgi:hypothetical protein
LIFRENDNDIGKTTVDSWGLKMAPWRHTNLSGELYKQLMFRENERDIGKMIVDSWDTNPGVETKVWQCN